MKRETEIRYPNSSSLFQFCRRVLDFKFGGIRVIDQDVGQILGFDPADCSHWKKGKKNIRSIQAMKLIAEHLGVDERLIVDVASGEINDHEAFFEFVGYGHFDIDSRIIEAAKKDYYRKNAGSWTKEKESEFKEHFNVGETEINAIVETIHQKINLTEAPLYLPEVVGAYADLEIATLEGAPDEKDPTPLHVKKDGSKTVIQYVAGTEMRPYMRFKIAKALAGHFIPKTQSGEAEKLDEYTDHVQEVRNNLFAAKLLAPANLIRQEMSKVNVGKDIIAQLAEIFWVSKNFMNRRLKDILQNQSIL